MNSTHNTAKLKSLRVISYSMRAALIFAFLGAVTQAFWTLFHDAASTRVQPLFGAMIVAAVAFIVSVIALTIQRTPINYHVSAKGIALLVFVGIAAFATDYFALKTFSTNLPLHIGGPIFIGGGAALAAVFGFVLGEAITWQAVTGVLLVMGGALLLGRVG